MRVGIIADDLTGAGDTAVQFVRAGWTTELQLHAGRSSASVVAVTTDSRSRSGADAAESVTAMVGLLRNTGITHLYKKVDSTLRGDLRAEVHAVVRSWSPRAIAIVCPAFPAAGRTVVNGQLRVNGVPVAETAAGADPVTPVRESHIPTLLGASHVAASAGESARDLASRITASGPVVVVDAANDRHLRRLAEAIAVLGSDAIAVGSAGLARHLAIAWAADRAAPPALVVVTSLHETTQRQAAEMAHEGVYSCRPSPDDLIADEAWGRWTAKVLDGLHRAEVAILLNTPAERARDLPATLVPSRFADLAARIVTRGTVSGVVVTGGDGARALVDALEATGINLHDEVVSGVPMGTLVGGTAAGIRFVSKAGGFGHDDTLLLAVEAIRYRRFR